MERIPFAITQSDKLAAESEFNCREVCWNFGWTDSRTKHIITYQHFQNSGKKVVFHNDKEVYSEISAGVELEYGWQTRKGHIFRVCCDANQNVVFSIDDTPFEEFMFPRPIRSPSEEKELDFSSDDDNELDNENFLMTSKYSPHPSTSTTKDNTIQYLFDIEVVNPTVQKGENFVSYTVNTRCDDPTLPTLKNCTVQRRYNDFVYLHKQLCDDKKYRGLIIPPLPCKQTMGRFDPQFLEERRVGLESFLTRIRDHCELCEAECFHSFLYESPAQLLMEKKAFYASRESDLRSSFSGWFGSTMHSIATSVGVYEEVGLGFNPLDVQINEIERYIEPLSRAIESLEKCAKNIVNEQVNCRNALSHWGLVLSQLSEMPYGPSTLDGNGLSLSQVLEMEPEASETLGEYSYLEDDEVEGFGNAKIEKKKPGNEFPSDVSDLTCDDITLNTVDASVSNSRNFQGQWGQQWWTESNKVQKVMLGDKQAETMTTVAEKECNIFLQTMSSTAESISQLQKDLASAHEIGICRKLNEYSRLVDSLKGTIKIRKDAKKAFTDSISVKKERYKQYNSALESGADAYKVSTKLEAYNEAKTKMLQNREVHVSISKNLIKDFHRFMVSKNTDMRKLAVDLLTFNLLNCQDNIDNWTNTLTIFTLESDGANI